jgi:hypothetical protein
MPTIAMYYYMCFIFLIVSILIDQILLLNLQNIASNLPMYLMMKSIFAPFSLPNSYTLRIVGKKLFKIVPNQCDKASVFSHLVEEFKLILHEASIGKIIGMIVKGENLFYLMKNLLNISARLVNQQQPDGKAIPISKKYEIKDSFITSKVKYVSRLFKMILTF